MASALPAQPPAAAHAASLSASLSAAPHGVRAVAPAGWQHYTVRPGDTLTSIAAHTGTTVSALVVQNRLSGGGDHIVAGAVLTVPLDARATGRPAPARAARPAGTAATPSPVTTYRVRAGDTIGAIALRGPATSAQILAANGLSARSLLHIGQVLRIPGTSPARTPAATSRPAAPRPTTSPSAPARTATTVYTVRSGDTIEGIAARTGVSQSTLIKANHLRAPYLIRVGQHLSVVTVVTAVSRVTAAAPRPGGNTFAGRTYAPTTVSAADRSRATLAATAVPTRAQMRALIAATAARYGVDQRLALAIGFQESGWDQRQVSVANAIGAMQVIPSSGVWASQLAGRPLDLSSAQDNATAGVVILRALTRSAHSLSEAIGGYYQGLGSVQEHGPYADTRSYVANVTALMSRV